MLIRRGDDVHTNYIHRKKRSTDDQDTSQIRVYEFYEPKSRPVVVSSNKEALEAKDLANDTFFYEKLKASIPKLKDGERDDVELLKNGKPKESLTDDDSDDDGDDGDDADESEETDEDDESSESDESSVESDGNEENDETDKSSQTKEQPAPKNKNVEFIQNPNRALKEVEKAFHNNNKYIEEKQRQADEDDGDDESAEEKKPVFKTKHFSKDFESAGDLLREVHTLVNKKKTEPDDSNGYWKIEYQNPIV
ncbi:nonsense-mediated mRNA decay protein 2-like [Bradysia coprophila]|uniref:nonsense-mediated mRNA decay protein 2-like n=1 Tax=Bradysia coprophila TaxID=38358 RepID=UPI00187DCC45|nr:nonsense-mediated mRNA decay protein 2-like [Bradysia coprophila]